MTGPADADALAAAKARHPSGRAKQQQPAGRAGCPDAHQWERHVPGPDGRWSYRCCICMAVATTADAAIDLDRQLRVRTMVAAFRAVRAFDAHAWQAMRLANQGRAS